MPLYEYACKSCGKHVDKIEKFDGPHLRKCPACGGPVERMVSAPAIQFKGSGWYVTDYGRSSGKDSSGKDTGSKDGGKESTGKDANQKDSSSKEGSGKDSGGKESSSSGDQGSRSEKSDTKAERRSQGNSSSSSSEKKKPATKER